MASPPWAMALRRRIAHCWPASRPWGIGLTALAGLLAVGSPGALVALLQGSHSPAGHGAAWHGVTGGSALDLVPPPSMPGPTRGAKPAGRPAEPRGGHAARSSPRVAPVFPALGIPVTILDAYRKAASGEAGTDPGCHLAWEVLAGIGKVESDHADGGAVDARGTALFPILGPPLDGTGGLAAIPNTNGARRAQGGSWARAVGPMQFIPATWATWGADGNGDGIADPENVYDATLAAAHYLCAGGRDLATPGGLRSAIWSYNPSQQYVDVVLAWILAYQQGGGPVPDQVSGYTVSTPAGGTSSSQRYSSPRQKPAHASAAAPASRQPQQPPGNPGTIPPSSPASPARSPAPSPSAPAPGPPLTGPVPTPLPTLLPRPKPSPSLKLP